MNPVLAMLLAPFYPTRQAIDARLGGDSEKLSRLSSAAWCMWRATAICCAAAWLMFVGVIGGLALVTGDPVEWRLARAATAVLGMAVLVNYPWPFRDQGSQWGRWVVLAVGVPSVMLFVGTLFT